MTLADFFGVLVSKVQVSVVNNATDTEVLNIKNASGVASNLSAELAGSTVKRVSVDGATSITVVIENAG